MSALFIRMVDDALEKMLRAELPLSERVGDITFDAPTSNWAAQLSRLTVNLFLYDVARSGLPASQSQRVNAAGRLERQPPQPMIALSYLVSAWAGSAQDEHQLLGEVINKLAGVSVLSPEHFVTAPQSSVHLAFAPNDRDRPREVWAATGGQMKASFTMVATIAADSFAWAEAATAVEQIEVLMPPGHSSLDSR